jgi:hypothetical protein
VDKLAGGRGDDLLVDLSGAGSELGGPGLDRCVGGAGTSFAQCERVNGDPWFLLAREGLI